MANVLQNIFNAGVDEVAQTYVIESWHVSQSVDALTAAVAYDISISGSLSVEGPTSVVGTVVNSDGTSMAIGQYSHAEGHDTRANGDFSHAEGDTSDATGLSSHAEGVSTMASGSYSHAEGSVTQAIGFASHAEGDNATFELGYSEAGGTPVTYFYYEEFLQSGSTFGNVISPCNWNQWQHTIIVNKNRRTYMYINGDLVSTSDSMTIYQAQQVSEFIRLGKGFVSNLNAFDGIIDDVGFWNRALSADEVQELYTLNACTFTIYDTVTVNNYVTVYDTVSVSTTDTLIINTLITAVQPAQENKFLVYPNPAHSQITIDNGNWSILGGYSIRIVNSAAQEVYNAAISQQSETIPLNGWGGNGLYVLYIIDPQQQIVAVKQIVLE